MKFSCKKIYLAVAFFMVFGLTLSRQVYALTLSIGDVVFMLAATPFVYVHDKFENSLSLFNSFRYGAVRGNLNNMGRLSMAYATGNGTKQDDISSIEWMNKALVPNLYGDIDPSSYYQKANRLFFGIGLKQDVDVAVDMLRNVPFRGKRSSGEMDMGYVNMAFLLHVGLKDGPNYQERDLSLFRGIGPLINKLSYFGANEINKKYYYHYSSFLKWNEADKLYMCDPGDDGGGKLGYASNLEKCVDFFQALGFYMHLNPLGFNYPIKLTSDAEIDFAKKYYELSIRTYVDSVKAWSDYSLSKGRKSNRNLEKDNILDGLRNSSPSDVERSVIRTISMLCLLKAQQPKVVKEDDYMKNECRISSEKGDAIAKYLYALQIIEHKKIGNESRSARENHDDLRNQAVKYLSETAQMGFLGSVFLLQKMIADKPFGVPVN